MLVVVVVDVVLSCIGVVLGIVFVGQGQLQVEERVVWGGIGSTFPVFEEVEGFHGRERMRREVKSGFCFG